MTLKLIPDLVRARGFTYGGLEFTIVTPPGMTSEQLGYNMYMSGCLHLTTLVYNDLGTEKLNVQIESEVYGGSDLDIIRFLQRSLCLDVRSPNALALAEKAFMEFKKRGGYLYEVFMLKLREWMIRTPLGEKERTEAARIQATAIADRFRLSKSARQQRVVDQVNQIKRGLLLARLKTSVDDE